MPVDLSLVELAQVSPREAPVSFAYEKWVEHSAVVHLAGRWRHSPGRIRRRTGLACRRSLAIAHSTVTSRLHLAVRALRLSMQTQSTFS